MSKKEQPLPIVARKLNNPLDIVHALLESPLTKIKDIELGRVDCTNKAVVPHIFRKRKVVVFDTSQNWPRNGDRVVIFTQREI